MNTRKGTPFRIWVLIVVMMATRAPELANGQTEPTRVSPAASSSVNHAREVIGQPRGRKLSGMELEKETRRVSSLLRCPVCQGLSLFDSPAPMAVNMKREAGELLHAGYTEEQVLQYFESSYGAFVRLEPPKRGLNWVVWLAPAFALVAGALVVWRVSRRRRTQAGGDDASDAGGRVPTELVPYLERVRAMAASRSRELAEDPTGAPVPIPLSANGEVRSEDRDEKRGMPS